jgi:phospholipase C
MVETLTKRRTYGAMQPACFNYETLGDELDKAKLSSRFYTPSESEFESSYAWVKHIFNGPDWSKDIVTPQTQFLSDVAHGKLANFTWVTPSCADSDNVGCGGGTGPAWVTAVVNVVAESKFWDTTAIFVQWNDWSGFYDHVPPPYESFDSLGFRVPLLVISPYAKANYVSHVQYETASVLRFAEDNFGLRQLSAADRRATSAAADCFDFARRPRKFVPIKSD